MSSKGNSSLKMFMTAKDREALGVRPTWHSTCIELCGVARPGKTAKERAKLEKKQSR
jgi:hypothetical protein